MFSNCFNFNKILKNLKNIFMYLQVKSTLKNNRNYTPKCLFDIVVAIAFYFFYLEIHQNNIFFYFLKFIFNINT